MDASSERFLDDLITQQAFATDKKYRKGQKEHGGKLWEKPGMLGMLMQETTDEVTYEFALKYQIKKVEEYLEEGNIKEALKLVKMILEEPKE